MFSLIATVSHDGYVADLSLLFLDAKVDSLRLNFQDAFRRKSRKIRLKKCLNGSSKQISFFCYEAWRRKLMECFFSLTTVNKRKTLHMIWLEQGYLHGKAKKSQFAPIILMFFFPSFFCRGEISEFVYEINLLERGTCIIKVKNKDAPKLTSSVKRDFHFYFLFFFFSCPQEIST